MTDVVPAQEARALAQLDQAKMAIAEARAAQDVSALHEWRDRAAAVQHYAARRDDSRRVADDAGEIKLHAERALGAIDAELFPTGVGRGGNDLADRSLRPDVAQQTITNWRKLGALDDAAFSTVVQTLRADEDRGVTTTAAVYAARDFLPKKVKQTRASPAQVERERRQRFHENLQTMAHHGRVALDAMNSGALVSAGENEIIRYLDTVEKALTRAQQIRDRLMKGESA